MRWFGRHVLLRFIFMAMWCKLVLGFQGAAQQIAVCLHTYLERDFMEVEPFLILTEAQATRILISGPEVANMCQKFKTMVDCYADLDGRFFDVAKRRRFSYLIHTLFTFHNWLCDHNLRLQHVMEHIACILRVQQTASTCKLQRAVPNVWQRMLRLEESIENTCPSLQKQLTCFRKKKLVQKHCGNTSQIMYESAMETWINGWCIDEPHTNLAAIWVTASTWLPLLAIAVPVMLNFF